MADIPNGERTPIFAIDRFPFASRAAMVEVVAYHLKNGAIVQVEDSTRPRALRVCYEIRPSEGFHRVFNVTGRPIGIFADVAALVDHAEAATGGSLDVQP